MTPQIDVSLDEAAWTKSGGSWFMCPRTERLHGGLSLYRLVQTDSFLGFRKRACVVCFTVFVVNKVLTEGSETLKLGVSDRNVCTESNGGNIEISWR